ncbi:MAG: glycosyltransferase family 39 protein [Gemmataceae bacterium]
MPVASPCVAPTSHLDRAWPVIAPPRLAASGLILFAAVWHLVYLIRNCPLDLAADEAHYWDWSRHLDWSYYSKGPLVAWLIRLSCELFGAFSVRLCGTELIAVRLPAVACGAGLLAGLYVLAARTLKSDWRALAVVATAVSLPVLAAGATVMTIDAPFTCAWVWALVFTHAAIFRQGNWNWAMAGVLIGIGILAKYTMVLLLPCVGMFLLVHPVHRSQLRRSGFWLACGIAAICCVPILIWNIKYDWVTVRHVGWQAGAQAQGIRWLGPLRFVVEQAGLLLFFWFACWAAAIWRERPGHSQDAGRAFLWWTSIPVFAMFVIISLKTPGQLNWPIAGYISGLILAVNWLANRFVSASPTWCRIHRAFLILTTVAGMSLTAAIHYPTLIQPILAVISGAPTEDSPLPMRRYDPTARLRGWSFLAGNIDATRRLCEMLGDDPIIATSFWNLSGEIAFYCEGHPDVQCLGPAIGQRMSQYDLWRPNVLWDPDAFRGRTFIFVGDLAPEIVQAFDAVDDTWWVDYTENGHVLSYWQVTICRGYRGFGPPARWCGGALHF